VICRQLKREIETRRLRQGLGLPQCLLRGLRVAMSPPFDEYIVEWLTHEEMQCRNGAHAR
jgi:hypothetical protein